MADKLDTTDVLERAGVPVNPDDPDVILAGIRVFGLAPDQSDLRILGEAIETLKRERDAYRDKIWDAPMPGSYEDREATGWIRFADHCEVVAAHAAAHRKDVETLKSRLEKAGQIIRGLVAKAEGANGSAGEAGDFLSGAETEAHGQGDMRGAAPTIPPSG